MTSLIKVLGAVFRSGILIVSIAFLTICGYAISVIDWFARFVVRNLERILGVVIEQDQRIWNRQRVKNSPIYASPSDDGIIDEHMSLRQSEFKLSPEQLIQKTKNFVSKEVVFGSRMPEVLSEDFQFIFPIVGPLTKEEFTTVFSSFKVADAFPSSKNNYFGFTVDPVEPNRVWYFSRAMLKHEGTLRFGKLVMPASGKTVEHTPQAFSVSYDQEGRVYKFTGGYPIDKTVGNAGGLGGVLGIIYALGGRLPLGPEAKPWEPSLQWEAMAKRLGQLQKEWKIVQPGK